MSWYTDAPGIGETAAAAENDIPIAPAAATATELPTTPATVNTTTDVVASTCRCSSAGRAARAAEQPKN